MTEQAAPRPWTYHEPDYVFRDANGLWITFHPKVGAEVIRAVNSHDALLAALEDCTGRFWACLIAAKTDVEYADIAVEKYHAVIALAKGETP